MYKLNFLPLAKKDMEEIVYYISYKLNNKQAANNISDEFIKKANNILNFTYQIKEYMPIKKLTYTYRIIKVKNFCMFYIIDEKTKTVTIMRILYQKRDIDNFLK